MIPAAPLVVTTGTMNVTSSSATLQGTATPLAATSTGWFRYSTTKPGTCDDSFGSRTPSSGGTALGAGIIGVPYQQSITGLNPGTTYYYCAIANNTLGMGFGSVKSLQPQQWHPPLRRAARPT